ESDLLAREALNTTLVDVLTSAETIAPVVVGIHAPWGYGKSSILRQLRATIDPHGVIEDVTDTRVQTHRLVDDKGKPVKTDISATWAWRRLPERAAEANLPYKMVSVSGKTTPITAWFNPGCTKSPVRSGPA